ncbi:MAG: SGNH/GDSL hydrolase family protein [Micrococcaceae bacterium]|nr:SGNH/GDSL hydrolase family protein [Micrococcaceae bacterium]
MMGVKLLGGIVRVGRLVIGAVAALALVGGGGAAALQVRKNIQQADGVQRQVAQCEAIKRTINSQGSVVTLGEGSQTVAILGDSYAAGDYLDSPADGWVGQLADAKDWAVQVDAIGGTGFINGGPCLTHKFGARVDSILATDPDVVLIEGGLNDHGRPSEALAAAVSALLDDFAAVPSIIVVGPTNAPAITDDEAVDTAMRQAVESKGRTYVSAYDWELEFLPDGIHMTKDSHARYASKLGAAVPTS